jgi:hypothetical protein
VIILTAMPAARHRLDRLLARRVDEAGNAEKDQPVADALHREPAFARRRPPGEAKHAFAGGSGLGDTLGPIALVERPLAIGGGFRAAHRQHLLGRALQIDRPPFGAIM